MMATAVQQQQQQQQQQQHQHSKELKTNVMNNDDNNIVDAVTTATIATKTIKPTTTIPTSTTLADISGLLSTTSASIEKSLATMELQYFKAVSLYRRRNYEKCVEVCNAMLQAGHENNVQMFNTPPGEDEENVNATATATAIVGGGVSEEMLLNNNNYGSSGNNNNSSSSSSSSSSVRISNNSSIQRYSSNLQRMAVRQGGRQRGIYGNNVSSVSAVNANATTIFANNSATNSSSSSTSFSIMPTWMMEGVWQLKMRALTQRIYIDDLETNDADDAVNEEVEFERIATTARPGTSIKTAFIPRPSTGNLRVTTAATLHLRQATETGENVKRKILTSGMSRPASAMARPGTSGSTRPGSSLGSRPASRCGTASRVRASSAAAFNIGDSTAPLYQASRLNPTIYAERRVIVKALFQFLYYHEADVLKAYSLCEAVMEVHKQKRGSSSASLRSLTNCDEWWWQQQMGRCLLALKYPRKAEVFLHLSLNTFPHPDTYILLSRLYHRLEQTDRAMDLIRNAVDKHPFDITFRIEQARLLDAMLKMEDAMQMYRLISKLNPINIEALAHIALNYFYDNNPEMALMYYRRILSLGVYSAELYCNIALCCLYGGQIDLVLPCFQRALATAKISEQKADIWYNISFVAITTGDFNLAKRCLQLCLTCDARNGAALNNLAVLAACTGDVLKAKSYLNAAKDVLDESMEIENNLKYMIDHYKL